MKSIFCLTAVCALAITLFASPISAKIYDANWTDLDARPTPQWYQDAKFGIFIHWGLYSVPAWTKKGQYAEWYWNQLNDPNYPTTIDFHKRVYGSKFRYEDFAAMFKAELFDPNQWAALFKRSGARYVVLTSKHHDGFCLWPSEQANKSWGHPWNSVDTGPKRDLLGDLTTAVRKSGVKMGFYYSLYEWYNPLYKNNFTQYRDKHFLRQFKDVVTRYKPSVIFVDGEWDHSSKEWQTEKLVAWLFNESGCGDELAINDRWGKETRNAHGGYYSTEYGDTDASNKFAGRMWEECRGLGKSFGFNRNEDLEDYQTAQQLIHLLIKIVSKGGNLLLDIGPAADGTIPVIMQERLIEVGNWLAVNGDAIYGSRQWRVGGDGNDICYTSKENAVYALVLKHPGEKLVLHAPKTTNKTRVELLGYSGTLQYAAQETGLCISLPPLPHGQQCSAAYVLKLTGVE